MIRWSTCPDKNSKLNIVQIVSELLISSIWRSLFRLIVYLQGLLFVLDSGLATAMVDEKEYEAGRDQHDKEA